MATRVRPEIDPMGPNTAPDNKDQKLINLLNDEGTAVACERPAKVTTVFPAKRKLVKTMVYHSFLDMKFTVLPEADRKLLNPHPDAVDGTQVLNSDMPAVTANCTVGGGKMKSVIPKRRKFVKTVIYHSIKDFLKSLFRPSPELHERRKPISHDL